jgi:hypothetical protein
MGAGMDDLDNDIKRTIDDAMDDGELLPNRYLNVLGRVC